MVGMRIRKDSILGEVHKGQQQMLLAVNSKNYIRIRDYKRARLHNSVWTHRDNDSIVVIWEAGDFGVSFFCLDRVERWLSWREFMGRYHRINGKWANDILRGGNLTRRATTYEPY